MEVNLSNISSNNHGALTDRVQATQPVIAPSSDYSPNTSASERTTDFLSLTTLKQTEQLGGQITISDQQVLKAIERAIKAVEGATTSLQFSVHERTKHISVKVLNKETGEVIREIPPEKNLDFLASLWEKAGILVDERR